jgi:alpha-tubulin suppressor-like RCC1 family protein/archaellum component FlaF (FlaF/FlaG flagellin family)
MTPAVASAASASAVTFTINATADRTPISPLIYGLNDGSQNSSFASDLSSVRPTAIRQGGNAFTAWNWTTNAANGGSDWCFDNYNEVGPGTATGGPILPTVNDDQAAGATSLVTVPIVGYVAADSQADPQCTTDDEVTEPDNIMNTPNYVATRLDVSDPTDPNPLTTTPSTTGDVYQNQFVYWLTQSAPGANLMFSLDNEPDDWRCTHAEVWPTATFPASGGCTDPYNSASANPTGVGVDYTTFMARELAYANAIKGVDPSAYVIGPVLGGYSGLLQLQGTNPSDESTYGEFVDYYLQQVHAADVAAGHNVVDAFDFHWYSQVPGVDSADTSPATVVAREQAPRSLWDPTYVENSWITQCCSPDDGAIDLLPWLRGKVATDNPGMPLSISEWRYGAGTDISGGIADADALGIFGRYGVHDAMYWPDDDGTSFSHAAFEMYRNYDGKGSTFGDTEVEATNSDPAETSVYASIDRATPSRVVIVAINKNTVATTAKIVLQNSASTADAAVYTLTASSATPQAAAGIVAKGPDTFSYVMPAQSVSVIVPAPATAPVLYADAPPATATATVPYTYAFGAAGSPAPTFKLASGSLPPGLTLSSEGIVSGTPSTVGTSTFTVSAANGHAPKAVSPSLTIAVRAPKAPAFTADSPPRSGTALEPYAYTFAASGAPPPTFALASGSLPPGLALSAKGAVTGQPTTPGTFAFVVEASNGVEPAAKSPKLTITVATPPAGTVLAWGDGADGQLGDGSATTTSIPSPVSLPAGTKVTQVVGGIDHALALTSTGQVYAWGENDQGQLGDDFAQASTATPVLVSFPAGTPKVIQVAAGDSFSLALTADGNVWGWGANWAGQLATDTGGSSEGTPFEAGFGGDVTSIAAGVDWGLAVTTDGNVLAWGNNGAGQLGNGTTTGGSTPVSVSLGSWSGTVVAVSANSYGDGDGGHSLALTHSGAVLAWGNNPNGELGNGTTTSRDVPVAVSPPSGASSLPPIAAVSAGWYHNLAVTTSGAVLAWGDGGDGQLGDGSTTSSDVPVYVSAPAGVSSLPTVAGVSANFGQSVIVTAAGALYAFGVNTDGQLGNGTTTSEDLPTAVTVPAGTDFSGVGTGEDFSFAIVGP